MHYVTESESREIWDEARKWLETKISLGLFHGMEDQVLVLIAEYLANTKFNATIYLHLSTESPFKND